ncbi:GNAT family N-acetyltransferase [Paenibacillus apii]|uniref:GNAT family N-acetyltransferase n=1 Tax=Paenibacillus apii TaxID=1850370 RepID=UPI00143AF9E8|nr:GNAT family N-acetyltransferase [Paenibacillus apii]NJJ42457.1 GNAT family N-acetyltransferase [Paenibacillus apii]
MSNNLRIYRGSNEEANFVRNKLIEYNAVQVPNGIYEEVNLCLKNDNGDIIAGLNSAVCWNWMEIDILWVEEKNRKIGLGKRLIDEAEKIARSKNCTFIKLNTFSFQAPEFYKKYGYKVAIIENAPLGSNHYYFKKDLK